MLITEPPHVLDEVLRRYFVGATRAKHRLFIHTDGSLFDRMPADEHRVDQKEYDMPDEVVLQMTHKDVFLGFFKNRKEVILGLRAGERLNFDGCYFHVPANDFAVAKLSQKMQDDVKAWNDKGYHVTSSVIRFVVAWRPKDAPKEEGEYAVLLIDLTLSQSKIINWYE